MSEDVTAVSMQISEKAAEAALSAFKSVLDSVGRLFRELLGMEHDRARAKAQIKANKGGSSAPEKTKPPNVTATNLTSIKPGEVSLKDLAENARETGELEARLSGLSEQKDAIIDPDETDEEETAEERAEREAYQNADDDDYPMIPVDNTPRHGSRR